ncbi:hypothetical protein [Paenibacillus flagellatus]|uniref:hypothetical protein n=1 Tax=Paenibacillus flagellatus TaxID=2211139 RepID=UPI0011B5B6C6|nr:hypothetical protein [Paenibacillus flagellatus]
MSHYFYITPEEYAQAAAIGVDNQTLDRRVRGLGWKKERAITTPIRRLDKSRSYWREVAEKNGISFSAFHSRLSRGWSPEDAATKPKQTPEEIRDQALRATEQIRKIPRWCLDLAAKNGIQSATLHLRIKKGMSFEEAATRPLMSRSQAGVRGAAALRTREGDWAAQIFKKGGS